MGEQKFVRMVMVTCSNDDPGLTLVLNTKYQGSWAPGVRQEDFFTFSLYKPM